MAITSSFGDLGVVLNAPTSKRDGLITYIHVSSGTTVLAFISFGIITRPALLINAYVDLVNHFRAFSRERIHPLRDAS